MDAANSERGAGCVDPDELIIQNLAKTTHVVTFHRGDLPAYAGVLTEYAKTHRDDAKECEAIAETLRVAAATTLHSVEVHFMPQDAILFYRAIEEHNARF